MIRFLNASDIELTEQAKELWAQCFEDDSEFINYYFDKRTKPEYILCDVDGGELRSMLHVIPKKLSVFGYIHDIRLVAGVSTKEKYRHRGISSKLIQYAHNEIDTDAFVLQPANEGLFAFYERFGYKRMCEYDSFCVTRNLLRVNEKAFEPILVAEELLSIYCDNMRDYDTYAVMTKADFDILIEEAALKDTFFAYADGAYAFCTENRSECAVMCVCGEFSDELKNAIFSKTSCNLLRVVVPVCTQTNSHVSFNMIMNKKHIPSFGRICSYFYY